jgi:hypothetical protein
VWLRERHDGAGAADETYMDGKKPELLEGVEPHVVAVWWLLEYWEEYGVCLCWGIGCEGSWPSATGVEHDLDPLSPAREPMAEYCDDG